MNSTTLILLAVLLSLVTACLLAAKAGRQQVHLPKQRLRFTALFFFLVLLLGSISVLVRMNQHTVSVSTHAPLTASSQVIVQAWSDTTAWNPSIRLSSLSGETGIGHWQRAVPYSCSSVSPVLVVADGMLYEEGFNTDRQELCIQASQLADGVARWSTTIKQTGNSSGFSSQELIRVIGTKVFLVVDDTIYVLDATTGKTLRIIKPDIAGPGAAVSRYNTNGKILVVVYLTGVQTMQYSIFALQLSIGNTLWKSNVGTYSDALALQGETLYTTASQQGTLVALNVQDGSTRWRTAVPWLDPSDLSVSATHLYAKVITSSRQSTIDVFDPANGRMLWHVQVDPYDGAMPVEANGITYVSTTNQFSALRASDGKLLWTYVQNPIPSASFGIEPYRKVLFGAPIVVDGVVFVASTVSNGDSRDLQIIPTFCFGQCTPTVGILALRASDGKVYWQHQIEVQSQLLAVFPN